MSVLSQPPLRVALTASIDDTAGPYGRPSVFLYTSYIRALEQIGFAAVLITPAHTPDTIAALLDACCGLVLTGGEDVDPKRYGEDPSPALGAVTPARDEAEFRALDCAIQRRMPIFGICRGLQVMNVHFGGTLYQDIVSQRPGDLVHEQTVAWNERAHGAKVDCDSMLCRVVATEQLFINSFHHQAVKHLGDGLRVVARADDGLVEAIEHESYPWMLGVQWHPERGEAASEESEPDRRLFLAFQEAVQSYAGAPAEGAGAGAAD